MTQPFAEITDKREAVHGFNRGQLFLSLVVFSPAGRIAKENPVGSFIAGPLKSFRINEGLKPEDRVVVTPLPVRRNSSGASAQQV